MIDQTNRDSKEEEKKIPGEITIVITIEKTEITTIDVKTENTDPRGNTPKREKTEVTADLSNGLKLPISLPPIKVSASTSR